MTRLALLALLAGCGDPALCTSDFRIAIDTAQTVTADLDPVSAGVQTAVEVDTSLREGADVLLQILDATGAIVSSSSVAVDAAGVASFGMITVPPPTASLRASATDVCGSGSATVQLDVLAGASCDLSFGTQPVAIPFYAPLPVFNQATDVNDGPPGEQVIVAVATRAGWNVELRERSMVIGDEVLASGPQPTPIATPTVTLREGRTSLFAICSRPPVTLTSAALFSFVDTIAPACTIEAPVVAGGQLQVAGRSADGDVEGEPVKIVVVPAGGAALDAGATPMASGRSTGAVALPPGTTSVTIELTAQDHAHNTCFVTQAFAL